ncbi:MAG: AraC family transcriptional regulator [Psychroserpens sp.]|uniref:helix-turn-helix domain-containing protein n=1 Tax=Psychroserpens sp. TaxID=2020870 RepID=UPI003C7140B2
MKICKVNSLPLRDVIESIADCLGVNCYDTCDEYYLDIPSKYGSGQIRGINFDNGLGIIIYQCEFTQDIRIDFTVDDVHPIKYIYSVEGPITHRFANEEIDHQIEQYKCAIVASESNNGHILLFKKDQRIEVVSLEIDRRKFLSNVTCEINDVTKELKALYEDVNAKDTFYHEGFYGIKFKDLLNNISNYENQKLIRKFYLQSLGLQIFVNQLLQFGDDKLKDSDKSILRINEINRVDDIAVYIEKNLDHDLTVARLSSLTALNPNKLQTAFKYLFNKTVNEFVTTTRLNKSKELLADNELNVSDVVDKVGFKSYSYFSKIFKQRFQISPSVFKESIRKT